jgi:hypothetical protein
MARTLSAFNGREDDGDISHTDRVKLPPKKETGEWMLTYSLFGCCSSCIY